MTPLEGIPTAFVGMLHTDESQFETALAAVRGQQGCAVSYGIIGGLEKQEASRRLYAGFNEGVGRFDVRARVDADMVIVSPHLLAAAARLFGEDGRIDTITVALQDFFTGTEIKGLHLWRREVRWLSSPGPLFGDAVFDTSRRTLTVTGLPRPVALHAPDPTPAQSARYGSHRALKAVLAGAGSKRWDAFRSVLATQREQPHPSRLISIAALHELLRGDHIEEHLRAVLDRSDVDPDRLAALSRDPALIEQVAAILSEPRELDAVCERLRSPVRTAIAQGHVRGTPRPAALLLRVRRSISVRRHGVPDEGALRRRFMELLGLR